MSGVWEKIAPSAVNSVRAGGIVKSSNILIPLTLWSLILIGLPAFVIQLSNSGRDNQEDFAVYYLEGEIIKKGGNPYLTDLKSFSRSGPDTHGIVHGSDPPTFLILCRGLAGLPIRSAYWIWQGFNFICLALVLLLLFSGSRIGLTWVLTFAGLAVLFPPVIVHFWFAQSKLPLALMLLIMAHSIKDNRHSLAGL